MGIIERERRTYSRGRIKGRDSISLYLVTIVWLKYERLYITYEQTTTYFILLTF